MAPSQLTMAAHSSPSRAFLGLVRSFRKLDTSDPLTQCLAPRIHRSFASQADLSLPALAEEMQTKLDVKPSPAFTKLVKNPPSPSGLITTLYSWPQFVPQAHVSYNVELLGLPLRKDILHRAVVYEADNERQGTASTKYRTAVHGSNRKIQQQKGTGRARVGDKKSPIRKGGGVAFGPHPAYHKNGTFFNRFATDLPRKVYDLAWRTALSYIYSRGDLIVVDGEMDLQAFTTLEESSEEAKRVRAGHFLSKLFQANRWTPEDKTGWSLLVTNFERQLLFEAMATFNTPATPKCFRFGRATDVMELDVKDLLKAGRVVIEKKALDVLLISHASDLGWETSLRYAQKRDQWPVLHQEGSLVRPRGIPASVR